MKKNTMFIKPANPGDKVHLEGKGREFLPDEGAEVERTPYYIRRLRDGSAVEAKRPAKAQSPKE